MKSWMKWGLAGLVVALLIAGLVRSLSNRQQQQAALAQQTARVIQATVELSPGEVLTVQSVALARGLPISGTLKAVNSAFVKVRVAGELQGLSVREGDTVQAGQVLARIDPTEYEARLRQAQLQADAAKAQTDIAQRQYDNNKALVDQGFISKTALDTSLASLNGARASYDAALAAVDVARKSLADAVLVAPMSGQISQRLAQPGERLAIDARVVEIVDLSRLEIETALSAADSVGVRPGQAARLQVEGRDQAVQAQVVRINPSTQAGTRSVLVYLQIQSVPGLRQGLFAQGTLGGETIQTVALPLTAVRTDKPTPYVQMLEGTQVRHVPVALGVRGQAAGQDMVAVSGLPAGSQVLAGSVGALRDGASVKPLPAR